MAKKKLTQIAEENEIEFDEALSLAQEKLPEGSLSGKGKNKHFKGIVLQEAPNPKWNYVRHPVLKKRVPVLIHRRWQGKLVGKEITFEAIEDTKGTTYRHVK
jgi:hypothetical protein